MGFFLGGDDLDSHAELAFDRVDEIAAVGGFADGGGGVGEGDVAIEAAGDALIAGENLEGVGDGGFGEAVMDEGGGSELGEIFFGREDAEGEGVGDFDDDHVEAVGADINGGEAQAVRGDHAGGNVGLSGDGRRGGRGGARGTGAGGFGARDCGFFDGLFCCGVWHHATIMVAVK